MCFMHFSFYSWSFLIFGFVYNVEIEVDRGKVKSEILALISLLRLMLEVSLYLFRGCLMVEKVGEYLVLVE